MEQPKSKDAQKELEIALGELEERVDRLRSLYEQYFMGYEKLEPSVQRRDVERRFTQLRKQQIRNTAARFRLNVVSQKYNTYSIYWTRVCRQIEEGTYKRHVAKAARRFGTQAEEAARAGEPAKVRESAPSIDFEMVELDSELELDVELAAAFEEATREAAPAPAPAPAPELHAHRIARHAALPPGAKQPHLVRRQEGGPRASSPDLGHRPPAPSRPDLGHRPPAPSSPDLGHRPPAPSSPDLGLRPPARSSPDLGHRPPAPSRPDLGHRPPAPSSPDLGHRPPAAARQPYRPVALPPGAGRVAVATPRTPMTPIRPIARPAPPAPAATPHAAEETPKAPVAPHPERRAPLPLPSQTTKKP